MGGGGFGEGVALEGRAQAAGGGFGEGAGFEEAQRVFAAGALEHGGPEDVPRGDAAGVEARLLGVGEGEGAAGPAEDEVVGAVAEQAEGGAGDGPPTESKRTVAPSGWWARRVSAQSGAV